MSRQKKIMLQLGGKSEVVSKFCTGLYMTASYKPRDTWTWGPTKQVLMTSPFKARVKFPRAKNVTVVCLQTLRVELAP